MAILKCNHCLLEFPETEAVYEDFSGEKKVFCCNGCCGIYKLVHSEGLDDFYKKRKWDDAGIASFKKEIDIRPFAEHVRDVAVSNQKEIDIYIDGIRCASCVWLNEKILSRTEGIEYARLNYATHRARIRWNPEVIGIDKILKRISSIGYNPRPYSESEQFKRQKAEARDLLIRFGTAGFLSSQLMIYSVALYAGYFQGIDINLKLLFEVIALILTIPVIFYSGMPFIKNTIKGLKHLNFTMDSLITIGAGSAFIYSVYQIFVGGKVYFDTSAMIITLIILGRYIESIAKGRASETIERLSELSPKEARLVSNQQSVASGDSPRRAISSQEIKIVPISSIKKGELIQVVPGERIPLDGIVVSGESEIDESIITGESRPVFKTAGHEVIGGSVNLYGALTFEVTRTGKETVLSGIIQAVEEAQTRRPQIQRLADRIVGYFVPAILIIAMATVIGYFINGSPSHSALMAGISVLVIACPCSLGLATPLAVMMFTTMASSKGILIRGGEVIENTSKLTNILFDKTGTITVGKPTLKEIIVLDPGQDREYVLSVAASIESLSEHSIGHAVTAASEGKFFPVSEFRAIPGKGVEGTVDSKKIIIGSRSLMQESSISDMPLEETALHFEKSGDTVIYMAWDRRARALFVISDVIKNEALETVNMIKKLGIDVSVVSGDNKITTDTISEMIGVKNAISNASPLMKKEIINNVQKDGHKVLMVGDGINDAPALTEASVGLAISRGTDIAIAVESSDVVLVRNNLRLIPHFIIMSKRTFSIIKQNIFGAFFYNIVAIPAAVLGFLHPIIAAGAMALSSLFVVGNSLRIRKFN